MNTQKLILSLAMLLFIAIHVNAQVPATRIYDAKKLTKVKSKSTEAAYAPAVKSLLAEADKELKRTPPSVMDKDMVAESGNKHDYMSMGPYWWPNPDKPDGLPYIRKDGQRNPELDKLDRNKMGRMAKAVTTLGLAYYFSDDEKYAQKAVDFLRVWFLDENTRMNPHLTYGQTIPGRNNGMGRGEGLIDTYSFVEMLDAVALLDNSKAMTSKDKEGMKDWFTQFVEWMQTSPVAQEENEAKNNHGLAFDVQLAAYALYTGNNELAIKVMKEFPGKRLFTQIEPDGKQPLELKRTIAFSYTVFNIHHMLDMSSLGKASGVDIYLSESEDGRSITAAINFMKQYVGKPQREWPYEQIKEWNEKQDEACWMLRKASFFDPDKGYEELSSRYRKTPEKSRLYLLFSLEN